MSLKSLKLLVFFILGIGTLVYGQQPPLTTSSATDTGKLIRIIKADKFSLVKIDSVTEKYILVGNVLLQQGTTLFSCDSAIKDDKLNIIEAFGNMLITVQ